jgi:hypothetical protein
MDNTLSEHLRQLERTSRYLMILVAVLCVAVLGDVATRLIMPDKAFAQSTQDSEIEKQLKALNDKVALFAMVENAGTLRADDGKVHACEQKSAYNILWGTVLNATNCR